MSVLLPLQPGTLPPGVCYASEQERLVDYASNLQAVLDGQAFYNFGSSKPDPAYNAYPWFRTTDSRWYYYSGGWISLNPDRDPNIRRIWVGDLTQLQSYDGGDSGAASDRSGPMWEVDTNFAAKFPVGVGTFAGGTSVAVNTNVGADEVTLTANELPDAPVVPLDGNSAITANRSVQKSGTVTGLSSNNGDFSGTDSGGIETDVNLKIEGNGQPFEIIPPGRGVYVIKPSARLYYFIP